MGKSTISNLKPCRKGETHNPNGRPKKLKNLMKGLPEDAQLKIYGVLLAALQCKNAEEAKRYIQSQDMTDFEYGFVLQLAVKALTSPAGWMALQDIMDRLFGKPRMSAEVTHKGDGLTVIVSTPEEKAKIESIGDLEA